MRRGGGLVVPRVGCGAATAGGVVRAAFFSGEESQCVIDRRCSSRMCLHQSRRCGWVGDGATRATVVESHGRGVMGRGSVVMVCGGSSNVVSVACFRRVRRD